MICRGWTIGAALLLAACADEPEAPAAPETAATAAPGQSAEVRGPERRILAFGDSLFAGYRLAEEEGYPEQLEAALRARGIDARVADSGISGDTTAGGRPRIAFVLDAMERAPDLALVELGGNDLIRGLAPAEARANLAAILAELQARGVPTVLYGMRAPPNAGPEYQAEFDAMYPDLAREYGAALVPFFMEPVYDQPALIQRDRIHPTAEGIEAMVAATVDTVAGALPKD
jgi:acyl-CoA thioesterase-1